MSCNKENKCCDSYSWCNWYEMKTKQPEEGCVVILSKRADLSEVVAGRVDLKNRVVVIYTFNESWMFIPFDCISHWLPIPPLRGN